MEPFATPSDVIAIWRPLTEAEDTTVMAWIMEASQQVRDEVPDIGGLDVDERITAGSLSADTVKSVVARMVKRVMQNPDGARQRSQSIDDYQESVTIDSALSTGEMYITAREMNRLTGRQGSATTAFMVNPSTGPVFT